MNEKIFLMLIYFLGWLMCYTTELLKIYREPFVRSNHVALSESSLVRKGNLETDMKANKLVTTGLYGQMRHPIYTGRVLIVIGWSLTWNAVYSLFIIPVVVWITFVAVIRFWEEPDLIKSFGEEYKEYRRNTPALFLTYLKIVPIALVIVIAVFTITGLIPMS